MHYGVWLHPAAALADLVDAIVRLDQAGVDEVWVADEGVAQDPFVVLTAAADRTERIRLGVGITSPLLRHPGAVAATAKSLDEWSNGRMMLGWGVGGHESLGPFGITVEHPVALVRDALDTARAVLEGVATDSYSPPPHASVPRRVPQFVGARGPRLNALASSSADGVFLSGFAPDDLTGAVAASRSVRDVAVHLYASVRFRTPPDPTSIAGTPNEVAERLVGLVHTHRPTVLGLALVDGDDLFVMTKSAVATIDELRRRIVD